MAKIILISCSSTKLEKKAQAKDLYISTLFRKSLQYAKTLDQDHIYILSAEHHLLPLSKVIEPYNLYLCDQSSEDKKKWGEKVIHQLERIHDLKKDDVTILAGEFYWKYLVPHITNVKLPLKGKRIGQQLSWLTKKLWNNNNCDNIHKLFNQLPRHNFQFDEDSIPSNGIYILFEKGEKAHGVDRIVRIGTHRGKDQLSSRLFEHFLTENKDRSIFRKNIGRAILNKANDSFLNHWEVDLTTKKARQKHAKKIDQKKLEATEKKVSKFIQSKFRFVVFKVDDKDERLDLESKIISTVSLCTECEPSTKWLGSYSPIEKIRESGLWLVQGLWKKPLNKNDIKRLIKFTSDNN